MREGGCEGGCVRLQGADGHTLPHTTPDCILLQGDSEGIKEVRKANGL